VRLASRGLRDMDNGPQVIADQAELRQVRRQARLVYAKAFIAAVILTATAVIL
jgi:predicted kinase